MAWKMEKNENSVFIFLKSRFPRKKQPKTEPILGPILLQKTQPKLKMKTEIQCVLCDNTDGASMSKHHSNEMRLYLWSFHKFEDVNILYVTISISWYHHEWIHQYYQIILRWRFFIQNSLPITVNISINSTSNWSL